MSNKVISSTINKSDSRMLYWISVSVTLIAGFFCWDFIELFLCILGFLILFTIISYIRKTIVLTENTIIIQSIFGKDVIKHVDQCKSLTSSWFLSSTIKLEFSDGNWYLFNGVQSDEVCRILTDIITGMKKNTRAGVSIAKPV